MNIAVFSDIHDNVWNLRVALHALAGLPQGEAADQLICCGDLCSPFVARMLVDFGRSQDVPVHVVFGNNDGDTSRITAQAQGWNGLHIYNEFAELALQDGALLPRAQVGEQYAANPLRIAVQHYDTIARPIAQSGQYRLVCFGHNHVREATRYGETLALNPGALMGFRPPAQEIDATFAMYHSAEHSARFYQVVEAWRSAGQPGTVALVTE